ncbi:MAG: CPBP family intramembrane metalloprotease [Acidobacteriota bacterium]
MWKIRNPVLRVALGLVVAAAVDLVALYLGHSAPIPESSFVPSSFVIHSVMLLLSLLIIWVIPRASFADFGFTTRDYRFKPTILLWVLPTAVLSSLALFAPGPSRLPGPLAGFSQLQLILFVWIYASVCEEVLTRGLLQTLVAGDSPRASRTKKLTMPIVVSALFFGAMHLVLIPSMGPAALVPIIMTTFLGFLAAYYRQSTGSLVPAILVHALFNVGGMLPQWVAQWVRG